MVFVFSILLDNEPTISKYFFISWLCQSNLLQSFYFPSIPFASTNDLNPNADIQKNFKPQSL